MQKASSNSATLISFRNKKIGISYEDIDPIFNCMVVAIERGLQFNGEDRPSASVMLHCLESLRYKALA